MLFGKRACIRLTVSTQILEQALSDLGFVKSLGGEVREVVVQCYIRGFKYAHGELNITGPS